jgi:hypothetical protein
MNKFKSAKERDKVILCKDGIESIQRIVSITPKSIRVSSCNLYRFNRNGNLNKCDSKSGLLNITIKPI